MGRSEDQGVFGAAGVTGGGGQTGRTRRHLLLRGGALAVAAGGAMAACRPPAGSGGSGEGTRPSNAPATIRFHSRGGAPGSQEVTLYDEQIPLFQEKHPNITVVHEGFTGEDFYQKITVLHAGGTLGDVMWTSVGGGGIYNLIVRNVITAVDPFVAREKFDLGQYYKGCIDGLKREGKLYGLPFKSHPGVSILFYNQTLFEQRGAGVPDESWTLDRLIDGAKKVTQGDVFGYFPATSQKSILTFTRAFGGELLDPEGKKSLLNSSQAIAAITWMYETFNKHRIAPTPSQAAEQSGVDRMFVNGKLGSGKWGTSFQITGQRDIKDSFQWFASLHPKGPAGVYGSDYEIDADSIITTSKQQEAGWQWVKWLTNQESGIRLGEIGGTVGGRPDVYKSPRLLKDPIRNVFLKAMETAQPGRPLYNTQMAEYEKVIQDGLVPVWEGKETPNRSFMDELTRQVQVVLDLPLPT
ncbi:MAG TPA: extracellular solute-binding protein [Chloroflexota bacterium]|nr:extracellular solute-binding protein [Chloroflexota bacterium]